MRARQLELLLAKFSGNSATDLDQRARRLRENLLVPSTGPGRNAPHIDARIAAIVLIAAASTPRAVDAVLGVTTFSPMVAVKRTFGGCKTFGEAVETILSKPMIAVQVLQIELLDFTDPAGRSTFAVSRAARITWTQSDDEIHAALYVADDECDQISGKDFDPLKFGTTGMYPRMVIGGGLLQQIAIGLQGTESGWVEREQAN